MSEATLVDMIPTTQPEIIELNVGGTVFTTLKETLTSVGGIFPHMMDHHEQWPKDNKGRMFLDRDPRRFRILLDWIRNKDKTFKYRITDDMKSEMEHFGLFADLLYEKMPGMLIHVEGTGLKPIQKMTLLEAHVDGRVFSHRQFDGCMLRTS